MKFDTFPPSQVVVVHAVDWTFDDEGGSAENEFPLYHAMIAGLLLRETENSVVLASEYFPDDHRVRKTLTIPKSTILQMAKYDLKKKSWHKKISKEVIERCGIKR